MKRRKFTLNAHSSLCKTESAISFFGYAFIFSIASFVKKKGKRRENACKMREIAVD